MELILTIAVVSCILSYYKILDIRYTNYLPPNGRVSNWEKENEDIFLNNLSKTEIKRNTIQNKYNKPL